MKSRLAYVLRSTRNPSDTAMLIKMLDTLSIQAFVEDRLPNENHYNKFDIYLVQCKDNWRDLMPESILSLAVDKPVVLFGAKSDSLNEQTLLMAGIKGAFYTDDTPETVLKGVRSVLEGELWFKRRSLSLAFMRLLTHLTPSIRPEMSHENEALESLTKREKTVIKLLAQGAKNRDIAEQLNISDHTVKTHIYSAFRKTHSRNRIELMNWAQRFLPIANIS